MSSDTFIAYVGLRFEISADELEGLELRSDPRIIAARKARLSYYWGNFGGLQERYLLFIGEQLGIFGVEKSTELTLPLDDDRLSIENVKNRLDYCGLTGVPELHLYWQANV